MMNNFRNCFLCAVMISSVCGAQAGAALILYEPFEDATAYGGTSYTTGAAITGANTPATASGQNNGPFGGISGGAKWFAAGPTTSGVTNVVSATNLGVTGLAPSFGGSMQFGNSDGPSARVNLDASYTAGTIYYSFALKVANLGSLGTSGGFVIALNNSQGAQTGTPTTVSDCVMIRASAVTPGTYNLGVRKGTGTPAWGATDYALNDTVFLVSSYTFNTGSSTDDVAKMWLNPDPSTFGGATPADQLVHTGVADIGAVASLVFFRRGTSNATLQPSDMFVDEVRVGTTWADVTMPIPEPGTLTLVAIAIIGASAVRGRQSKSR